MKSNTIQLVLLWMLFTATSLCQQCTAQEQSMNRSRRINMKDSQPDVELDTPGLIQKHGYPVETHVVTTGDGYILTVHRIPRGRGSSGARVRAPVLLMHGFVGASDEWVFAGPDSAPGFLLADAGYDVWLGNARGNYYSRKHVTLSPRQRAFWNFSWHEMGNNDLPAVIDHILQTTNQQQLFYVGHSLGVNFFFSLMTTQPEYNKKIKLMSALGPSIFYKFQANFFGDAIVKRSTHIANGFLRTHQYEMAPRVRSIVKIAKEFCDDGKDWQAVCAGLYYLSFGNRVSYQLNKTLIPSLLQRLPSGTSVATMEHALDNFNSGRFERYDSSRSKKPVAQYDLSLATSPVALFYTTNDAIIHPDGVVRLSRELPNVVGMYKVADKYKFNHMDFVIGIQVKEVVYDNMIDLMNRF